SGALPEEPLIHLRHDLVSYSSTPGNIGYLLGLERELAEALVHAERLVKSEESGDLAGARSHAEHIVNIIEGQFGPDFGDLDHDGRVQNPGDGYGVLQNGDQEGYLDGGLHHVLLAAASPSAPEAISRGADAIRQLGTALQEQVTEIRDRALKVAAAQDVAAAREDATALLSLTRAINEGEGGAKAIYAQVQGMASVALAPVPVGTSIDAPPPVRIAAEAQPQVLIDIGDDTYAPNKETVVAGTTIVWKNTGASAHTVTAEDGSFNSKALAPGDTFAYTFTKAEAFPYYCTIHGGPHGEGMAGAVEVSGRPQTQGAQP
ncbi:MAG: hypothetical protein HGA45_27150, partial [Chloroflexales bacterium]|nr:hypothetical protein [Chloroflexales bacterium]